MLDLRLIPAVIFATSSLLALKVLGFASGEPFKAGPRPAQAQEVVVQDSATRDRITQSGVRRISDSGADQFDIDRSITGSAPAKKAEKKEEPKAEEPPKPLDPPPPPPISASERAILERLQERRATIDERVKEITEREQLLKAAEKRLEERARELKDLESRVNAAVQKRDDAETQRMRGVVSMYETMKPKDAARIFDELEMPILMDVAQQMKPAKLADVIAQMSAPAAKRLTTELARRPNTRAEASVTAVPTQLELPKIEGKPVR